MAIGDDSPKIPITPYRAALYIGGLWIVFGLIAALFEVRFLQKLRLGWGSILLAIIFLVFVRVFRVIHEAHKAAAPKQESAPLSSTPSSSQSEAVPDASSPRSTGPKPVSFVASGLTTPQPEAVRPDLLSKSLTPEILNLRFVAYRCEIAAEHLKAIYQNATHKELKWFELSSLVIRQFPFQEPWEGKLLLDIIPNVVAGERIQPVRVLSTTYVNYGFLPQGQSASTKENIRRLASYILSQNRSIFVDPGTDYFVHAGQPPVRFLSMSQFVEYDSRYG